MRRRQARKLPPRDEENFALNKPGRTSLARRGTLLAFKPFVLEHTLTEEERSQILQTIEMFEVITQTQPDDYQSLLILKEGHQKLGNKAEALRISRKLAEAYFNVASYTLAQRECEAILAEEPNAPDTLAMLGEIDGLLNKSRTGAVDGLILSPLNSNGTDPGGLAEIGGRNTGQPRKGLPEDNGEMGNGQLAKFLIVQQMFPEEDVTAALASVSGANKNLQPNTLPESLLLRLANGDEKRCEKVLSALIDRTKFAYVPLEYYDIDRQVVRMLPDELTVGRLFVPFDLVSRTIMIAVSNPFDTVAREAVQQSLDYTVAWYLARPSAVAKTLQDIYRLEGRV